MPSPQRDSNTRARLTVGGVGVSLVLSLKPDKGVRSYGILEAVNAHEKAMAVGKSVVARASASSGRGGCGRRSRIFKAE